jgi:type IV/VI secretion system ImpK/VasF family protein
MKNEQWESIHTVLESMERLFGAHRKGAEKEAPGEGSGESGQEPVLLDLVRAREQIRSQLDTLREKLAEHLSERDCYLVLFPIVAHFDEIVQTTRLDTNRISWPPLQRELFEIDDAGEMFYETLNDILMKPQTLPLVYEVYYYCLNDGFRGRYNDNPVKINECMEMLRMKISPATPEHPEAEPERENIKWRILKRWDSPVCYYAGALFAIGALYFVLHFCAQTWGHILD